VVALVVAFLTLYLSLLRHADVEIDTLMDAEMPGGFAGALPGYMTKFLFASNLGVDGALLTSFGMSGVQHKGTASLFNTAGLAGTYDPSAGGRSLLLSLVLTAGEVRPFAITVEFGPQPLAGDEGKVVEAVKGDAGVRRGGRVVVHAYLGAPAHIQMAAPVVAPAQDQGRARAANQLRRRALARGGRQPLAL
jgi:hypothetical protein